MGTHRVLQQFQGRDHEEVNPADGQAGVDQGAALLKGPHPPHPHEAGGDEEEKQGKRLGQEERRQGGHQKGHDQAGFHSQEQGGIDGPQADGDGINQVFPQQGLERRNNGRQVHQTAVGQEADDDQHPQKCQVF